MLNEKDIVAALFLICLAIAAYAGTIGFGGRKIEKHLITRDRLKGLANRDLEQLNDKYRHSSSATLKAKQIIEKIISKLSGNHKTTEEQDKKMRELNAQLYSAGINMDGETYTFIQNGVIILCLLIGVALAFTSLKDETPDTKLMIILISFIAPVTFFRYGLKAKISSRKEEIEKQLPNVLDLLSISVEAGMGFDQALDYIIHDMNGPLIDELIIVSREMTLGKSRKEAFDGLSKRTQIDSVKNFSSAVVQATDMGLPLKNVLVSQAEAVRSARFQTIKAKAAKASIKMLVPMVMFIFPVLLIILMGPAILNMMDSGIMS
jgi:tight adherence protein C